MNYFDPLPEENCTIGFTVLELMGLISFRFGRFELTTLGKMATELVLLPPDLALLIITGTVFGCQRFCIELAAIVSGEQSGKFLLCSNS